MDLHTLQSNSSHKKAKRVGRGGKRGTYSGHGMKGQKARAGARIRPGFRGGDNPIWKLFPKLRGASKKTDIKHRTFRLKQDKPAVVNLGVINRIFTEGEVVSPKSLVSKGAISTKRYGVKILSEGIISKKLTFRDVVFSETAKTKIDHAGSTVQSK